MLCIIMAFISQEHEKYYKKNDKRKKYDKRKK